MFRKALIAFSLMLVSGVLFYDSAYTHSGRTEIIVDFAITYTTVERGEDTILASVRPGLYSQFIQPSVNAYPCTCRRFQTPGVESWQARDEWMATPCCLRFSFLIDL